MNMRNRCVSLKVALAALAFLLMSGLVSAPSAQAQDNPGSGEDFLELPEWAGSDLFTLDLLGQDLPEWGEGELPQSDLFVLSLWESLLESPNLPPSPITQQLMEEFTLPNTVAFPTLEPIPLPPSPDFGSRKEAIETSWPSLENTTRLADLFSHDFTGLEESGKVLWEQRFNASGYFDAIMTFSFSSSP